MVSPRQNGLGVGFVDRRDEHSRDGKGGYVQP